MARIKWADNDDLEPEFKGRPPKYRKQMATVKANQWRSPGKWALIVRYESLGSARTTASKYKKQYPDFQVRSRKNPTTGMGEVWVRYVGFSEEGAGNDE